MAAAQSTPGSTRKRVELRIPRDSAQFNAEIHHLEGLRKAGEIDNLEGRILRVAVAMRGGVSLAVWIGGAVAELDLLRSIRVWRRTSDDSLVAVFSLPTGSRFPRG